MEPNNAHRIFLDASILRVCSLGNADLQYLWIFPFCKLPLQCVTSSYVLAETLAALAEPDVPPKSRIAVLNGLGLLQTGWHVRLPEPSLDAVHAMQTFCRHPEDCYPPARIVAKIRCHRNQHLMMLRADKERVRSEGTDSKGTAWLPDNGCRILFAAD